ARRPCRSEVKRGADAWSLPLQGLSNPQLSAWKIEQRPRRGATLPLGGGGPFLLASIASLEKRGEGDSLPKNAPDTPLARVTPSPFRPKRLGRCAPCGAKAESPPPPRGRVASAYRTSLSRVAWGCVRAITMQGRGQEGGGAAPLRPVGRGSQS